jgi:hypothetical protein
MNQVPRRLYVLHLLYPRQPACDFSKQLAARRAPSFVPLKVFSHLSSQSAIDGLGQQSVELRALHSGIGFAQHLNSPAST